MAFLSLLPEAFSTLETWVVRIFLLLAFLTVGPWIVLLVYDITLYTWRSATYDVPGVGGRARGRERPRAPSLTERPSGIKRRFSIAAAPLSDSEQDESAVTTGSTHEANGTHARTAHELTEDAG
ncbi:hypothetical protein B0A50_01248 [Salinomyces thailandicus]|uniref:Uncharacterized protein n=1 Tax=Salinomyces thailandicus TaxID=706561 RepID=A0A4U0U9I1_9PEZI|nr:hypothetical protein B0A50_01248 [Salinomyces thailandica]